MDLALILLFLPWCLQAQRPSYFYGRQLTLSQAPCFDAKGDQGTCMFRFDCIRENGYPMTTCKEKFLFGVCCKLQEESVEPITTAPVPPLTMPSTSQSTDAETWEETTDTIPVRDWTQSSYHAQSTSNQSPTHELTPETESYEGSDSHYSSSSTHSEDTANYPVLLSDQHGHVTHDHTTDFGEPVSNSENQFKKPLNVETNNGDAKPQTEVTVSEETNPTIFSDSYNTPPLEQNEGTQQYPNSILKNQSTYIRPESHISDNQNIYATEPSELSLVDKEQESSIIALTHFLLQNASLDNLNELDTTNHWTEFVDDVVATTTPIPLDEDNFPASVSHSPLDALVALLHPGAQLNTSSSAGLDVSNTGTWEPSPSSTSKPTTQAPTTQSTTTTSERPVWDYRKTCGVRPLRPTGRVVGGRNAYFGEWPWQVLVKEATWLGLFVKNKCGGVLINKKFVLTAAHCQPGFLASLLVILGEYDLTGDFENLKPLTKNVKRMIVHRDYNPQTFENDIALLELDSPVQLQPHIVPICLPKPAEDFAGKRAYVSGWGKLTHGGSLPSVLQAVRVPIARNSECQQMFLSAGHIKAIRDTFICAGFTQGGRDSCEGDSGGPLMIQRRDLRWVLVGTVSHGIGCADPNLPGVYMRTTSYLKWLSSIIGPES